MKLEAILEEAVYLAPKVYGGRTRDSEYVKVKGLKTLYLIMNLKVY